MLVCLLTKAFSVVAEGDCQCFENFAKSLLPFLSCDAVNVEAVYHITQAHKRKNHHLND